MERSTRDIERQCPAALGQPGDWTSPTIIRQDSAVRRVHGRDEVTGKPARGLARRLATPSAFNDQAPPYTGRLRRDAGSFWQRHQINRVLAYDNNIMHSRPPSPTARSDRQLTDYVDTELITQSTLRPVSSLADPGRATRQNARARRRNSRTRPNLNTDPAPRTGASHPNPHPAIHSRPNHDTPKPDRNPHPGNPRPHPAPTHKPPRPAGRYKI